MTGITRPVVRYHGGKFRLAQWITSFFPRHRCYLEPFAGAFSAGMYKPRVGTEIYNDLESGVVNLFRVLRDPIKSAELQRRLALTPYSRDEFNESYAAATDDIDQAHKLCVRAAMGHGGDAATRSCRSGFRLTRRERGVFGSAPAQEWATFAQEIEIFCERLAGVTIENQPALDVIARFDSKETLIYCDPPYVLGTRTMMKGKARKGHGYKHEMTDEDHQLLATALHSCKSMVVLSGYRSDLYKALFADWQQFECESAIEGGAKRTEVVWINPACSRALIEQSSQKSLFQEGEG